MNSRAGGIFLAVVALVLAVPATAPASTQLGQTPIPTLTACTGNSTLVQVTSPASEYVVPAPGVITSWSYRAASVPPSQLRLKILVMNFFMNFTAVGQSAVQNPSPNTLNTFPTRITVHPGERLGLFVSAPPATYDCVNVNVGTGYSVAANSGGDQPVGSPQSYPNGYPSQTLDVSAVLEPDADGDGFGDETQDACPTDGSLQGDCAPPDTTITQRPADKVKTKKKQAAVTFAFSADEAATFECSLDGAAFTACTSPDTLKVKKGTHHFEVRAIDSAGNVDGSPAGDDWKVKRKKKK
jgi:hypothetical protein